MGGDWDGAESCIQLLPALLNPPSAAGKQAHVPRALPKGQCLVPRLLYSPGCITQSSEKKVNIPHVVPLEPPAALHFHGRKSLAYLWSLFSNVTLSPPAHLQIQHKPSGQP